MRRADERQWHYQPGDFAAIVDPALIGRSDEISFCYKASTAWMEKERSWRSNPSALAPRRSHRPTISPAPFARIR
ncbi:hypothetical protein CUJ84_Chr001448 [Rhizobium leguminosarum]|uniref:Uncharacterized protein n=1 Tax=Rhizobium leguminosarum TaxID=384 RepID=A0A2K9Z0T1_RHILE|nr:hypothetical protein CUJ84_Chr001448 [Rhizobium leguminosarum]